jgi:hypothetical protein
MLASRFLPSFLLAAVVMRCVMLSRNDEARLLRAKIQIVRHWRGLIDDAIIERLCSDERMQSVWTQLAALPDDQFCVLVGKLLYIADTSNRVLRQREFFKKMHKNITDINTAQRELFTKMHGMMADARAETERVLDTYYVGTRPQTANPSGRLCAQKIEPNLNTRALDALDDLVGRKVAGAERTLFMKGMAAVTKSMFGRPHYEVVAILTNVVFNTTDDDDVSAEAVKMACQRQRQKGNGSIEN